MWQCAEGGDSAATCVLGLTKDGVLWEGCLEATHDRCLSCLVCRSRVHVGMWACVIVHVPGGVLNHLLVVVVMVVVITIQLLQCFWHALKVLLEHWDSNQSWPVYLFL